MGPAPPRLSRQHPRQPRPQHPPPPLHQTWRTLSSSSTCSGAGLLCRRSAATRRRNVQSVESSLPPLPTSQGTDRPTRPSPPTTPRRATSATSSTSACPPLPCTFKHTSATSNVTSAPRLSLVLGCFKTTRVFTPERSHTDATSAGRDLQTDRT